MHGVGIFRTCLWLGLSPTKIVLHWKGGPLNAANLLRFGQASAASSSVLDSLLDSSLFEKVDVDFENYLPFNTTIKTDCFCYHDDFVYPGLAKIPTIMNDSYSGSDINLYWVESFEGVNETALNATQSAMTCSTAPTPPEVLIVCLSVAVFIGLAACICKYKKKQQQANSGGTGPQAHSSDYRPLNTP